MKKEIIEQLKNNGLNSNDYKIDIKDDVFSYYPKRNLDIRRVAKEEDENVKVEAEYNSATGMFELLQLSENNIKKINLEISKSDFENIMIVSELSSKMQKLENKIQKLEKEVLK